MRYHLDNGLIILLLGIAAMISVAGIGLDGQPGKEESVSSQRGAAINAAASPYLRVTSPNGGEEWNLGDTHSITWSASSDVYDMSFVLWFGTGPWSTTNLGGGFANDGEVPWTISSSFVQGDVYKLEIKGYYVDGDGFTRSISDNSDGYFSLTKPQAPASTPSPSPPSSDSNQESTLGLSVGSQLLLAGIVITVIVVIALIAFVQSAFYVRWVKEKYGEEAGYVAYQRWKKRKGL